MSPSLLAAVHHYRSSRAAYLECVERVRCDNGIGMERLRDLAVRVNEAEQEAFRLFGRDYLRP
jgi:hypothetical protein